MYTFNVDKIFTYQIPSNQCPNSSSNITIIIMSVILKFKRIPFQWFYKILINIFTTKNQFANRNTNSINKILTYCLGLR